jgi:hypothetical protein
MELRAKALRARIEPEQITDDSARGGLLGGRLQLLVKLSAALAMAIAGVGKTMVWSR